MNMSFIYKSMLLLSFLNLGCFSTYNFPILNADFLTEFENVQPIKVSILLNTKESIQFEIYIERKNAHEYQIFGVHPVIGKIFLVKVFEGRPEIIENYGQLKNDEIAEVILKLNDERKNLASSGGVYEGTFSENGIIRLTH